MGTLGGFPNPPAHWLRRAEPASANAIGRSLTTPALVVAVVVAVVVVVAVAVAVVEVAMGGWLGAVKFSPQRTQRTQKPEGKGFRSESRCSALDRAS